MIVNANSIVEHVIKIKNKIIKHVSVNVKIIIHAKEFTVGILAQIIVINVTNCNSRRADVFLIMI